MMSQRFFRKWCVRFVMLGLCSFGITVTPSTGHGQVVRFETNVGNFDIRLFADATPGTVANFLNYVESDAYVDSLVHRNVGDFVIQGGGFKTDLSPIATDDPILNEPGISNVRGTIAMAKRSGDVNSATSQWYINIGDNSFLDTPRSGEFTAFGEVLDDGMSIVDKINGLTTSNLGGAFVSLPVIDPAQAAAGDNMVVVNRIYQVPEPATCSMALIGLAILVARRRRQQSAP